MLVGDKAEKGRLFKLYRQPLAKRSVKHGVARLVDEIGEYNRVLIGEFWRPVEVEVACDRERQHSHGGPSDPLRALRARGRRQDRAPHKLQALEVGANFRSVLVA